jgi:hypothetical protein
MAHYMTSNLNEYLMKVLPSCFCTKGIIYVSIHYTEPEQCRLTLLGTLPASQENRNALERLQTIIRIEKTAFSNDCGHAFFSEEVDANTALISKIKLVESTDIVRVTWNMIYVDLVLSCSFTV